MASGLSSGLRTTSFAPENDDARTANWLEAVNLGFHEQRGDPKHLPAEVDACQRDGRILTAVYDDTAPDSALDPAVPVATYATMVNSLNVGGGRLLPAHLVTAVTVRPTHRRRGILRSMITSDLQRAKEAGLALAGLTASEATIYGRFGFGAATSTAEIRLDTRGGLGFTSGTTGSIAVADSAKLRFLAPDIYRAHLERTNGAMGRQHRYWMRASAAWSEESFEPDKALRGVLHYNANGVPDGYAAYKSLGWRTEPHTVKVTDLVAASDDAYRELWRYLGSMDLVDRLTFDAAPVADPLPWMLADRRRYSVTSVDDVLWLRILDTRAALESRHYTGAGSVVLTVRDPLGMADGVWQLDVEGGSGRARPVEAGAIQDGTVHEGTMQEGTVAAEIDVAALGSLYLGGVSAPTLAAAGGIRGSQAALEVLDALFTAGPAPYCSTHF
ncbi:GNAT family N-acetyltransferase [Arthrobacter sunyaminii]|uniref:GNAT family N-acetyltransferase n=1 Tax=Arthrobacter sunyaminii TaxID=2816859 RepID=A0A975S475_9MICC|nr:GNAT family N-acetyltransferase [Arthrobacter sunyaminii]MBO0895611.1 GNAT family N-acetyltransferase [Arthrobacter sunyaminii]MBO0907268.1 GNAT family N-acetyltransferase [Arthrobacter sunyaminii]QWQ34873.1 GNAT family N-acetyltransferase [Arthrobacter sunyaminii]